MKQILHYVLAMGTEAMLPAVCLLLPVLLLCRRKHFNWKLTVLYAVFLFYLCAVSGITGLPTLRYLTWDPSVYLIPFGDPGDLKNGILNVLLFLPMGFFLPLLCRRFAGWKQALGFVLGATLFIEISQLFTIRLTDINDILTNTLGGCLGYWASLPVRRKQNAADEPLVLYAQIAMVVAFQFLIQPYLLPAVWAMLY